MNKADSWSKYWVNEGALGEVFVGKDGKKHPYLSDFWIKHFAHFNSGSRIIDLACGGGSIFADTFNENNKHQLFAADVSDEALKQLNLRLPKVTTLNCSVDSIPIESGTFDVVVSQFGIEYAGKKAFLEAARLLSEEGLLVLICHIKDGFIDSKNKINLMGAKLLESTGFIEHAIALTEAAFAKNSTAFELSNINFTKIEPEIAAFVENHEEGIHTHCYAGFRQMFQRKQHYLLNDIVGWLKSMQSEVTTTITRLSEIRKAAQSEQQIKEISELLKQAGLVELTLEPFTIPGHNLPLAWSITGKKLGN